MEQRLATDLRTHVNFVKKLILGSTITGCLIAAFILLSQLFTLETMAFVTTNHAKYIVSGNAQGSENQQIWDILNVGDTVEIKNQLKLKGDLDLTKTDIVIHLNGGEILWTAGHRLNLGKNSKILRSGDGALVANAQNLDESMSIHFGEEPVISWDGHQGNLLSFDDVNNSRGYDHGLILVKPELIYFESDMASEGIRFKWATSAERSNRCFEVQKSTDGIRFETISVVPGNGTTTKKSEYEWLCQNQIDTDLPGYYRIVQVSFDGEKSISPVIRQQHSEPDGELADMQISPE